MQTSVEWLHQEIIKKSVNDPSHNVLSILEQAKEMHKQEIMNAANTLLYHSTGPGDTAAEQYYQETFKKDL